MAIDDVITKKLNAKRVAAVERLWHNEDEVENWKLRSDRFGLVAVQPSRDERFITWDVAGVLRRDVDEAEWYEGISWPSDDRYLLPHEHEEAYIVHENPAKFAGAFDNDLYINVRLKRVAKYLTRAGIAAIPVKEWFPCEDLAWRVISLRKHDRSDVTTDYRRLCELFGKGL